MVSAAAARLRAGSPSCCLASSHQPQPETCSRPFSVPFTSATVPPWSTQSRICHRHPPRVEGAAFSQGFRGESRCRAIPGTNESMEVEEDALDWGKSEPTGVEQDSVDWDHMNESELQNLWTNYGETVVSNPDVLAQEDLDDTDSKEFAVAMATIANQTKAVDVRVLHVAPFVYWTRVMVLVTAFSRPQVNAIGTRIREAAQERFQRTPDNNSDDGTPKSWTVVDFGDVVIHVFLPKEREYYALDEYYKEADAVPLPFADRSLE